MANRRNYQHVPIYNQVKRELDHTNNIAKIFGITNDELAQFSAAYHTTEFDILKLGSRVLRDYDVLTRDRFHPMLKKEKIASVVALMSYWKHLVEQSRDAHFGWPESPRELFVPIFMNFPVRNVARDRYRALHGREHSTNPIEQAAKTGEVYALGTYVFDRQTTPHPIHIVENSLNRPTMGLDTLVAKAR